MRTAPMTREERYFQFNKFTRRFRVENLFGRLKWRFPTLPTGLICILEHAPVLIGACFVPCNIFMVHEGEHLAKDFYDTDEIRAGTGWRASTHGDGTSCVRVNSGSTALSANVPGNTISG